MIRKVVVGVVKKQKKTKEQERIKEIDAIVKKGGICWGCKHLEVVKTFHDADGIKGNFDYIGYCSLDKHAHRGSLTIYCDYPEQREVIGLRAQRKHK